jgi:copper chaperone NosL
VRNDFRCLFICLMLGLVLGAGSLWVFAAEKMEPPVSCQRCGMNRVVFAQSRMFVTYADGTSCGTCSLHCTLEELKRSSGKQVKTIQVADFNTGKLIDAKQAVWVIGGNMPGVMTLVAKWAFKTKAAARSFIAANGGSTANWTEVQAADNKEGVHKSH